MTANLLVHLGDAGLSIAEAEAFLDELLWRQELGEDLATSAWHQANSRLGVTADDPLGLAWIAVLNFVKAARRSS